ncbi:MAG: RNA-binding S4 domain-containing protein [Neisseriaceae bacterium]|nr:RNA-binding S4 domain-containing protein [Neisseriaceae bacterium]MBP6863047.1 RNA-binding S4 domain-containing protein [Neisseriaceae bacterium]
MTEIFYLEDHPHVALCNLLKMMGVSETGGQGKMMVAEGMVHVNGVLELRKTAKILAGSIVSGDGFQIEVRAGFDE